MAVLIIGGIVTLIVVSLAIGIFWPPLYDEDYWMAGLIAISMAVFWPLALPCFLAWGVFYGLVKLGERIAGH